ncbi:MAG TPA: SRPBCC domain-containing protein [Balneolaceae bacterium]|nr:SRPBCC domain-containing protein [Balneolaceae bacterium]
MENKPLIIEQTLAASAENVWKAITQKEQMDQWYFSISSFKPEVGFKFQFEGGDEAKSIHLCKVIEVIPGKKLAYTWQYEKVEGISVVTFELFAEGDKTKVKLSHSGLETFPDDNPDFSRASFADGWAYIIGTSLKEFVESR